MTNDTRITCSMKYPGFPDATIEGIDPEILHQANHGDGGAQHTLVERYFAIVGEPIASDWTWTMMVVGHQSHLDRASEEEAGG